VSNELENSVHELLYSLLIYFVLHLAKNFQFVRSPHFATGHYSSLMARWGGFRGREDGLYLGVCCQRVYCTFVARQTYNFRGRVRH